MQNISIFKAYIFWLFLILINFIWYVFTRELNDKFGADLFQNYLAMVLVIMLVIHGVGATLAWYTHKEKKWAKWLFIMFCLSFALDSFFSIIELTEMYKHTTNYNPYKKSLAIIVWCTLAAIAWNKSSNKSFKPTPKSGAV